MPSTKRRSSNTSAVIVVSSDEEQEEVHALCLCISPCATVRSCGEPSFAAHARHAFLMGAAPPPPPPPPRPLHTCLSVAP